MYEIHVTHIPFRPDQLINICIIYIIYMYVYVEGTCEQCTNCIGDFSLELYKIPYFVIFYVHSFIPIYLLIIENSYVSSL